MKGIQYVTDDMGKRTAVLIHLVEWGEIQEDIQDVLVSESRKNENIVSQKMNRASKTIQLRTAAMSILLKRKLELLINSLFRLSM